MYNVNDLVVYRREVCLIKEIKNLNGNEYYVMYPVNDDSLKIQIPRKNNVGFLRDVISQDEAQKLIANISLVPTLDLDVLNLDNEYKALYNTQSLEDLVKIIKTTYARNEKRKNNGKKLSEKDNVYFQKSEKALYTELAVALDMNFADTKKYVLDRVNGLDDTQC